MSDSAALRLTVTLGPDQEVEHALVRPVLGPLLDDELARPGAEVLDAGEGEPDVGALDRERHEAVS